MKDIKAPVLAWLVYLIVLGVSVAAAMLVSGMVSHIFSLICAFILASLILTFFMGLRGADNLLRVFALAGGMWLLIMLVLTLVDYNFRDIGYRPVEPATVLASRSDRDRPGRVHRSPWARES